MYTHNFYIDFVSSKLDKLFSSNTLSVDSLDKIDNHVVKDRQYAVKEGL